MARDWSVLEQRRGSCCAQNPKTDNTRSGFSKSGERDEKEIKELRAGTPSSKYSSLSRGQSDQSRAADSAPASVHLLQPYREDTLVASLNERDREEVAGFSDSLRRCLDPL